jgi:filamentous hemagglutinin family protein
LLLRNSLLLGALPAIIDGHITLDGSLGPQGPLAGPQHRIGTDGGQTHGSHLFHSFGEFNVPTWSRATFTGPDTISNIRSRVSGGQPSAIDGPLRSEVAGANPPLRNPMGVFLRPNARLDTAGVLPSPLMLGGG